MEVWTLDLLLIGPTPGRLRLCFVKDLEMVGIDTRAHVTLNLDLSLGARGWVSRDLLAELFLQILRNELVDWPCLSKLTESLKIASILMHRDRNNTVEDGEDAVHRLKTFFKLQVLVPEGVGQ